MRQIDKAYRVRIATGIRELRSKRILTKVERSLLIQLERVVLG